MKISECDIDCYLVDWYGIDKNGYVFQGYSTGTPLVPEFVCLDYMNGRKEFNIIEDYFLSFEGFNLENIRYIKELDENMISNELRKILNNNLKNDPLACPCDIELALKGITPFETLDGLVPRLGRKFAKPPYHYRKVIEPTSILNTKLLHFDQLSENIQKIMDSYRVDVDVQKDDYFYIPSVFDSPLFEQE